MIKSRLQQRHDASRLLKYSSSWEVVKLTARREGVAGFFKGLGPALLRVMPQSAIILVVYENVLSLIQNK